MTSYCRAPVTYTAHQRAIVGDTKMSVIGNDHLGWMKCDGRTLNVNDYYLLWRVIGYSFGSNGTSNTFKLPNAAGRVPGVVGTGTDSNMSTFTVALGDSIGEYEHTLTIPEMPTHNHGVEEVSQPNNEQTSASATGITINSVGDHTHAYSAVNDTATVSGGAIGVECYDSVNTNAQTGAAGGHTHTITDPTHFHTIIPAGGSNSHNNVQPMLGLGNMFIFSGKYMAPSDATVPFAGYPYLSNSQIL